MYESHNFTQSIREVSIDGDHPGGVIRSPLHGATVAQAKVKTYNLKEIAPCSLVYFLHGLKISSKTLTDAWQRKERGSSFPSGGWRQRVPECMRFDLRTERRYVMKVYKHSLIVAAVLTGSAI
jgi:hypothetical protein